MASKFWVHPLCTLMLYIIPVSSKTASSLYIKSNMQKPNRNYRDFYLHQVCSYITCFIYILTDVTSSPEGSYIMLLSTGLGGTVIFFVITIVVSVYILIKSRKIVLSQKVDIQHYTKPPAG